jgi:signal transduction histidine kinase
MTSDDQELMAKALRMSMKQIGIVRGMADRILGLAVDEAQSFRSVDVKEAVEDAVACLCRDLTKDSITLSVHIDESPHVWADPKQLQQVLFNLLINARQAITHRSGRITITAEANGEKVALRVKDNGCGIPPENLDSIFDAFVTSKAGNNGEPGFGGIGLGLALCRDIVEEHRGTITVDSEPDVGTTFTIILPASK